MYSQSFILSFQFPLCASVRWVSCIANIASFLCFINWFIFSHLFVGVSEFELVRPLMFKVAIFMFDFVVLARRLWALGFLIIEFVGSFCLWWLLWWEFGLSARLGLCGLLDPCSWLCRFSGLGVPLLNSLSPSLGSGSVAGPRFPLEWERLEPVLLSNWPLGWNWFVFAVALCQLATTITRGRNLIQVSADGYVLPSTSLFLVRRVLFLVDLSFSAQHAWT